MDYRLLLYVCPCVDSVLSSVFVYERSVMKKRMWCLILIEASTGTPSVIERDLIVSYLTNQSWIFLSEFDNIAVCVGITGNIYVPFPSTLILRQSSDSCLRKPLAKSKQAPGKVYSGIA